MNDNYKEHLLGVHSVKQQTPSRKRQLKKLLMAPVALLTGYSIFKFFDCNHYDSVDKPLEKSTFAYSFEDYATALNNVWDTAISTDNLREYLRYYTSKALIAGSKEGEV
jgi:hypothetical protein